MRVVSAAVLLAVIFGAIWFLPPWATVLLAALVAWLGAGELAAMAAKLGIVVPSVFVGAAAAIVSVAFLAAAEGTPADALAAVLLALLVAAGAVALSLGPPDPSVIGRASTMVMAPLYLGLPLGVVSWVLCFHGPAATTWLLVMIAVSDSGQYYCGRAFGRRKLAPSVSPAKTVEGAVGGVLVAAVVGAFTGPWALPGVAPIVAAGLSLVLALAGIIGDLFESLLKRSAGVKDSSHLIPGHGGVLDRIDSHLFAAPVFYIFLRYIA
jgi:phosphatidate cytidylyltransferase